MTSGIIDDIDDLIKDSPTEIASCKYAHKNRKIKTILTEPST